jgi:hypothetical protein
MKRGIIILISCLYTQLLISQIERNEIVKISLRYNSTFSPLPELYEVNLHEKTINYINPIEYPDGKRIETKKLNKKKWKELNNIIKKIQFKSLVDSTSYGIDGAWYFLNVDFSNNETRQYKIWSGNAPTYLCELHKIIKKNK